MTGPAELELEWLIEAATAELTLDTPGLLPINTLLNVTKIDALTVTLALARALRAKGAEVEDHGWHLSECALAFDWSHYQLWSPCTCKSDKDAIAGFDQLLAEIVRA